MSSLIMIIIHLYIWTVNMSSLMMIRDIMNKMDVRAMKEQINIQNNNH